MPERAETPSEQGQGIRKATRPPDLQPPIPIILSSCFWTCMTGTGYHHPYVVVRARGGRCPQATRGNRRENVEATTGVAPVPDPEARSGCPVWDVPLPSSGG
ncbi:MAG: hypothetical protein HC884_11805 [Chloroflexaceae bacterium]|nr:hypothetical protein [Chloroflexaceae bacterium]